MFKQITCFEKFNIFVGNDEDLLTQKSEDENQSHLKGLENNYIRYNTLDPEIDTNIAINLIVNNAFSLVHKGNVYIITNSKENFINSWVKDLISYLS